MPLEFHLKDFAFMSAELVIVTEAVKEKHLEDALAHLVDMDTTREIGTVIREY